MKLCLESQLLPFDDRSPSLLHQGGLRFILAKSFGWRSSPTFPLKLRDKSRSEGVLCMIYQIISLVSNPFSSHSRRP